MKCEKFGCHFFSCQSLLLGTNVPNVYIYIYIYIYISRHCQWPRKPCDSQVCYQDTQSCVSGQESRVTHKCVIKTHSRVSAAKKAMWLTSVLFTGTANSPFSAPRISITTGPISIKFTYFMPSIYATLHTKFERNQFSSSWDMCSWKLPYFLHLFFFFFFFFFAPFYNSNFEPTKNTLPMNRFLSNLAHI